ncbi:replication factor A protein 1-like isoform X1 [Lates japonicus]|uniref:Replication factor A protein 1-like isoform X1 n=1 Tax=Lates japonicus TaxID=270547 RepID=A0AAD3ND08_LATJO|nr:replication factor A protein 1-like isoform X1 [Lates japonicus]GLD70058.1 replication factor A protein 1-like isoform X1 [Lates japonicus]
MVKISMEEWKTALTSILEKLDQEQYKKLQKILNKLPQSKLTAKYKENMPKKIIEYYGVEESISAIKDAVDQIPRNDPAVQDLLRPFVDKLKKKQEKNKGKKRKHESDSESKDKKQKPAAAQQSSSKPEERKSQLWRKTIADLKTSGDLEQKAAKRSEDKTIVTVEGTITKIGPVEPVKLKAKRGTKDRQDIKLKDDTDEISISLWGEDIKQLRGKSEGDVVKVTDVKTNHFRDTVSLNSTDFTRIVKVQSAPVQNVGIEIIGITTANKMETYLETECNSEDKMSLKILETKWKKALTSILEELKESEYKKLLFALDKIPTVVKSGKSREEMQKNPSL